MFDSTEDIVGSSLLEKIGFTCSRRFVALDPVALNEDTVNRHHITGLQVDHVTDEDVVDGDFAQFTRSNNLDDSVILLLVQLDELSFLLPIVGSSDHDDNDDGNNDGNSFYPFHLGHARFMGNAEGLVQTKG